MSVFPTRIKNLLEFCEQRQGVWVLQAAAIGLPTPLATDFKNATIAARAAWTAQLNAEQALRNAVIAQQNAVAALRRTGGDCVRIIRGFAEIQANPDGVYAIAQLPPPATPAPAGPPGTPEQFKAGLNPDGSVTMRWKCVNPPNTTGTVYKIVRRAEGESGFTPVAVVGVRNFTDTTIPAGVNRVEYVVTAQRAEFIGQPASPFIVMFGQSGGASVIAAQFMDSPTPSPLKQAA
jgi:hypothetical protein